MVTSNKRHAALAMLAVVRRRLTILGSVIAIAQHRQVAILPPERFWLRESQNEKKKDSFAIWPFLTVEEDSTF